MRRQIEPARITLINRRAFLAKLGVLVGGIVGWRLDHAWSKGVSPADPRRLRVMGATSDAVRLRWDRPKDVASFGKYHVMRREANGRFRRIASVSRPGQTSYTDRKVSAGVVYRYQVRVVGDGKVLGESNRVRAHVPLLGSEPPPDPDPASPWSGEVHLDGVTIEAGAIKRFDPNQSTTLSLTGNLVVRGVLEMRPAAPGVVHTIRFEGVDESAYVGGGMEVLATDVGLWVMGDGRLDIQGTPRAGWNRTGTDPSWQPGNETRRAPHEAGNFTSFPTHSPGTLVPRAYPEVPPTEVFNLTRNVVIEGTPGGRAHVFIHSLQSQSIRYAVIRHMSPGALGRYPLHLHHCGNGSRGSLIEGVVVRESGDRGFVAHASHGITFRDCVAFDVENAPFWWDHDDDSDFSNDVRYEHCLAARIGPESTGKSGQNGFRMMGGTGNAAIDCVVVGNGGSANAGGFHWPAAVNHAPNVWRFEDCVAHNNKVNGIFVWQNDGNPHVIDRFTGYHNGEHGIEQGAYANSYHYRDSVLVANESRNLVHHSNSRFNDALGKPAGYSRVKFHAKGRTSSHILKRKSNLSGKHPVTWDQCEFFGDAEVLRVDEATGGEAAVLLFIHCLVNGQDMEPSDVMVESNPNGTIVRGRRRDGTSWQVGA